MICRTDLKTIFVFKTGPILVVRIKRDRLHRETMDFLRLSKALHSCQNILSEKELDISLAPRGAAEPQGQVVQGGGQLPGDRGVVQGRAAGKPGPLTAASCLTC